MAMLHKKDEKRSVAKKGERIHDSLHGRLGSSTSVSKKGRKQVEGRPENLREEKKPPR